MTPTTTPPDNTTDTPQEDVCAAFGKRSYSVPDGVINRFIGIIDEVQNGHTIHIPACTHTRTLTLKESILAVFFKKNRAIKVTVPNSSKTVTPPKHIRGLCIDILKEMQGVSNGL